jgi:hypothetical protein
MSTRHSCDACGAGRVPSSNACGVCGVEYTPWTYLTHEQAFKLLITLEQRVPVISWAEGREVTYIVTNYDNDRATIAMYDGESGHISDL